MASAVPAREAMLAARAPRRGEAYFQRAPSGAIGPLPLMEGDAP